MTTKSLDSEVLISVDGLKKKFDGMENHALCGVSTEIRRGEVVFVVGPSGSGKSTFLRCLNLLEEPTEGTILFEGVDITDKKNDINLHRRKIGMVFQQFNLFPHMTVMRNLTIAPMKLLGLSGEEAEKNASELLERVGLADRANAYPNQLSGGQKQRVAIAGIIAMRPECIVLDEPTAMLDPKGRKEVLKTIRRLNNKFGITIILITHYMEEAALADRIVVMDNGEIIMDGVPRDVFSNVELMKKVGLDVPQVTELMYLLGKSGLPSDTHIIDEDECANALLKLLNE